MQSDRNELILAYLQGRLTADQHAEFESWINASDENRKLTEDFRKVWQLTQQQTTNTPVSTEADWQRISLEIGTMHPAVKTISLRRYYGIAAAILLLIVSSAVIYLTYFTTGTNVVETKAETQHITLPDGSEIWMNGESRIAYLDDFSDDRFIILEGEAFFDVKPNTEKPFRIRAGDGEVKVVGTSFNVKAYKEEKQTSVYVVTGKVKFANLKSGNEQVLTPGLTGILDKENKRVTAITGDENDLAWRNKKLVFRRAPMSVVVKTLKSYYKTEIIVSNDALLACRFTGSFDDAPIEEVIETLTTALDLKVAHEEDTYTLDGAGCN